MLGSFSQPGQFVKQLQQFFFEAYVQNVVEYNLAKFWVEISGFFKQRKMTPAMQKTKSTLNLNMLMIPKRWPLTCIR